MSRFHFKDLPTPILWLIRPALFLSLGLHLLLLLLPLLPDRPSDSAETEETEVSLTPLPIEPIPEPVPSAVSAPPSPASPSPISSSPSPSLNPLPPQPSQPSLSPAPSIPQPQPAPTQPAASIPPATPAATPSVTPSPTATATPPQNRVVAPFASFPHMSGAQPGCFNQSVGECRQVSGNFRQVSQALTAQLKSQGYDVKRRDDLEETGRQVYEVTKDGSTRYLSVISSDLAGTAYILADEPVTQVDIEQIGTVQTSLQTLLSGLANGGTATSAQFAYPEFFFTAAQPRPEITQPAYFVADATPAEIADRLTSTLETNGFQLSQIGEYGGGPIYEVGQRAFLGYINLAPTQDGTGTIIVLWQSVPLFGNGRQS